MIQLLASRRRVPALRRALEAWGDNTRRATTAARVAAPRAARRAVRAWRQLGRTWRTSRHLDARAAGARVRSARAAAWRRWVARSAAARAAHATAAQAQHRLCASRLRALRPRVEWLQRAAWLRQLPDGSRRAREMLQFYVAWTQSLRGGEGLAADAKFGFVEQLRVRALFAAALRRCRRRAAFRRWTRAWQRRVWWDGLARLAEDATPTSSQQRMPLPFSSPTSQPPPPPSQPPPPPLPPLPPLSPQSGPLVAATPRMRLISPPSSLLISPPSSWWQLQGRVAPPSASLPPQPSSQSPPASGAATGHSSNGQAGLQLIVQHDHADSLARARLTGALFAEARSYYQSIE